MTNKPNLTRREFVQRGLFGAAVIATGSSAAVSDSGNDGPNAPCEAVRATEFLNSIGVCSAVSVRGETLSNTLKAVRTLGIRWIRAGYESGIPVSDLIDVHKRTGIRFSYGLMSGGADLIKLLDGARQLASVGALLAIEGNNEPNNWGITYQDQYGGRDMSWLAVAALQRD